MRPIILIPARLASTRLPRKPLAPIAGLPMIVQVLRRAEEAGSGPVVVAAAEAEVAEAVEAAGGRAVLTDPALPSGSDRIHAALQSVDPDGAHDVVINLQGDLPTVSPEVIRDVLLPLEQGDFDIGTLAALITEEAERTNPNVTKAVVPELEPGKAARALYFTRATCPWGDGPVYHHIGIYAYRRKALDRFVSLPPSNLETRERLEQLRALEAGMTIGVALSQSVPLGVDTPEDLEVVRRMLA